MATASIWEWRSKIQQRIEALLASSKPTAEEVMSVRGMIWGVLGAVRAGGVYTLALRETYRAMHTMRMSAVHARYPKSWKYRKMDLTDELKEEVEVC